MQLQGNLSSSPPPGNNSQSSTTSSSATNSAASAANSIGSDDGRFQGTNNGSGRNSNQIGITSNGKVIVDSVRGKMSTSYRYIYHQHFRFSFCVELLIR